ncbi:MAG: aminotransferase class III-fold pyridoxal phosphate-dependent enzyme [Nanoarchaeota archaeon]|nr:aminotransferase class III-fold pyridoxal phosphate-dependent enzyme [Nanoarchaeota archaeon]
MKQCGIPGKKAKKIIKEDEKYISHCVTRGYKFVYKKAKGCHVWDADGKKFLDFCSSIAVMNIGHTNPNIVKAIKKQLKDGFHCGFTDFFAEVPLNFAKKVISFLPSKLNQAFISNSGTESVEAAYKMARWHTNKKWVIAFHPCFHGRTMGSLSMTDAKPIQRDRFEPFLPVKHTPYPYCYRCAFKKKPESCSFECLNALEKTIKSCKGNLAAIFIEPIAGEPGYIVPPLKFHQGLRKLCNEHDVLFCADEIQSGSFRTGKFLALDNYKVVPDIVSLSKAIGGGLPIGVTVANKKIQDWPSGSHANTFGGNLISCAAGIANLDYMKKKKLGNNAKKIGNYMIKRLTEMKHKYEIIGDVRGIGLMIGIEIVKDKKSKKYGLEEREKILCSALKKGLILLPCGTSSIRFAPPLIITKQQADKGLQIFEDNLKEVDK